jgi:hypothetical protein
VLWCAVDNRLNPLYIGLPGTIGAAMGVGNPDAKYNALVAKFTFSHSLEPPRWQNSHLTMKVMDDQKSIDCNNNRIKGKLQVLFEKSQKKTILLTYISGCYIGC